MIHSLLTAFIDQERGIWISHPQGSTPFHEVTTGLTWQYFPRFHLMSLMELNAVFQGFQILASIAKTAFDLCKTHRFTAPLRQLQLCQPVIEHNLRWIRSFQNLHLFLQNYYPLLSAQKRDVYLRPHETGFVRPIQITQKGKVLIHYTKKKEGDLLIGVGASKIVKLAVELFSNRIYTTAEYRHFLSQNEYQFLNEFKGVKGFVQMHSAVEYFRKGRLKSRVVFEYYQGGNLETQMRSLSASQRKGIFIQLIQSVAHIHKKGLLHRDLKKANIFLKEGEPIIGDLTAMCKIEDIESRKQHCTTRYEVSPEYAKARLRLSQDALVEATNVFLDSWSLACILYELLQMVPTLPWFAFQGEIEVYQCLASLPKQWLKEPQMKNSPQHLVWQMFQQRLTVENAKTKLNEVNWSCHK